LGLSLASGRLLGFLLTGHDFTNPTQERATPVAPPAPLCGPASAPLPALAPASPPAAGLAPPSPAQPSLAKPATWGSGLGPASPLRIPPQPRPTRYLSYLPQTLALHFPAILPRPHSGPQPDPGPHPNRCLRSPRLQLSTDGELTTYGSCPFLLQAVLLPLSKLRLGVSKFFFLCDFHQWISTLLPGDNKSSTVPNSSSEF
jgi:hypothetical protein